MKAGKDEARSGENREKSPTRREWISGFDRRRCFERIVSDKITLNFYKFLKIFVRKRKLKTFDITSSSSIINSQCI